MAIPGNRHCANCIGALSFPFRSNALSGHTHTADRLNSATGLSKKFNRYNCNWTERVAAR